MTGTIPQHPLTIWKIHGPFLPNSRNRPLFAFVCFAWNYGAKNWECNQPPWQPSNKSAWCSHGVVLRWTDEITSSRFRFDPFRSGNGKKRRSWNMLLFLKKPIDGFFSKQMQTTQEKTNFIHFICAEQKCANEWLIVTMTFWHSFMGLKHRAPGLFEFPWKKSKNPGGHYY